VYNATETFPIPWEMSHWSQCTLRMGWVPSLAAYVDFHKAFNSVNRDALWRILGLWGIPLTASWLRGIRVDGLVRWGAHVQRGCTRWTPTLRGWARTRRWPGQPPGRSWGVRRKVDTARWDNGTCPHTWPDLLLLVQHKWTKTKHCTKNLYWAEFCHCHFCSQCLLTMGTFTP